MQCSPLTPSRSGRGGASDSCPVRGMAPEQGEVPEAGMRGRACTGRQRLGVGTGRTEKTLGDPEQEEAELAALPPGWQSLCQLGRQQPVPYAGNRFVGCPGATLPTSPGSAPPAGAACSEPAAMPGWQRGGAQRDRPSPWLRPGQGSRPAVSARPRGLGLPLPAPSPVHGPSPGLLGALRLAVGARRFGDALPARRLQVREGDAAVPGSAGPGSAPPPRRVPGTSRALLKHQLPLRNHLRADRPRDGAGRAAQPRRVSPSGPFGFQARTGTLRGSRMRGGRAALPDVQHSNTTEEGTLPLSRRGRDGKRPPWQPVRSLRFCFSANSLLLLQNKNREPKAPVLSVQ